ncbi:MAG TPA: 2-oxoacid:acceptor oxidoreductase subunit alpha [Candidatus Eisenbacteria bacterium]|nr:2-oxoacid:acceptor oxidoreductase subunit alpha [Candidatus Eisenbacteria bacterium]
MNRVVNDFSIHVATVNGSGSQTANNVLLRAVFQMGVPVSGKNLFPSNIAGLPTWFTIRVSRDGWVARRRDNDVLVVMNPETAAADVAAMGPGTAIVANEAIRLPEIPADRHVYRVPVAKLVEPVTTDVKLRRLVANMVYVGVLAELLGIDEAEVARALAGQLGRKPKALALNQAAVQAGAAYARASLPKTDPFRVERMHATAGKILIDGNTAAALGALFAGVTVVTWYPITPSSSLVETLIGLLEKHRREPETGRATFAVVQAEDEIAAIGMTLGAGWAGARAMTSTSGPGISLMAEFAGYGYYAEIPAVIWDVQRVGPSTGLPTRTAQADLAFVASLSHGDTQFPVLLPATVRECYEFAGAAFDLAERLQSPVFVLSDLDLGMNNWMSEPFEYPAKPWDRGKVLDEAALAALPRFERYRDVDGDGIPWRTLPGVRDSKGAYFTRGSGHDEAAHYTESPEAYVRNLDRLKRKLDTARGLVPAPELLREEGAAVGLIAFGSSHPAVLEARAQLRAAGVPASYLRVRALPFAPAVAEFVRQHARVYVVEQNRDAQLTGLLRQEAPELAGRLRPLLHYTGLPLDAAAVADGVRAHEQRPAPEGAVR